MFHSLRASHLALRIGLALVFLWFGADKFIHPQYWADAWLPRNIADLTVRMGMSVRDLMFLNGIFEVLVAVSLVSGFFIRTFASLGAAFLLTVFAVHVRGATEVVIRDVGLFGGLAALILWPERTGW